MQKYLEQKQKLQIFYKLILSPYRKFSLLNYNIRQDLSLFISMLTQGKFKHNYRLYSLTGECLQRAKLYFYYYANLYVLTMVLEVLKLQRTYK